MAKPRKSSKRKTAPAEAPEARDVGGRPTKYKPEFAKKAEVLCRNGATDADLADFFKVTTRTIQNWSAEHERFFLALKEGKSAADDRVERALWQRAVGYEYDQETVVTTEDGKTVTTVRRIKTAPDTTACIYWSKNRRPKDWRDKADVEVGASDKVLAELASMWRAVHALPAPPEKPQARKVGA